MIPGGLVARYGLRACPLRCAGRCKVARDGEGGHVNFYDGRGRPFGICQLMSGPAPAPGSMPALDGHTVEQLRGMARRDYGADRDVCAAAEAELRQKGSGET